MKMTGLLHTDLYQLAMLEAYAVRAGASREEILEAGFLAAVTRGGLTLPDLVPLMRALDELSDG